MDCPPFYFTVIFGVLLFVRGTYEAPAVCRSCTGHCKGNEVLAANANDTALLDAIVDNETVRILNLTISDESEDGTNGTVAVDRIKRQSYIEKRTCSSKFQLELYLIPLSIAMIPCALVGLLFCVCCCGPKDSRGHAPEKILGVRLSQRKKVVDDFDEASIKSTPMSVKRVEDEELEYKDGYVQRRDSKKTRFSTNVLFIEPPLRRASSVSCFEGLNSRRGSFAVPQPQSDPQDDLKRKLSRHISFNDNVSVLGEEETETVGPLPSPPKRKGIFKRSISIN